MIRKYVEHPHELNRLNADSFFMSWWLMCKIIAVLLFILLIVFVIWVVCCQYSQYRSCNYCGRRRGKHRSSCGYKTMRWTEWFKYLFSRRHNGNRNNNSGNNSGNNGRNDNNNNSGNNNNIVGIVPLDLSNPTATQVLQQQVAQQCCVCTIGNQYLTCLSQAGTNATRQKCCFNNYNTALKCCQGSNPGECSLASCAPIP